jgi:hypothetical protein
MVAVSFSMKTLIVMHITLECSLCRTRLHLFSPSFNKLREAASQTRCRLEAHRGVNHKSVQHTSYDRTMMYLPHSSRLKPTIPSPVRNKKAAKAPPHRRRSPYRRVHPLERNGPIISAAPGLQGLVLGRYEYCCCGFIVLREMRKPSHGRLRR